MGRRFLLAVLTILATCTEVKGQMMNYVTHSEHKMDGQTNGTSGVECTHIKRKCLKGLRCVNEKCLCPEGMHGNAEMECVPKEKHLCTVSADPHLDAFGGAHADVDLPCRYRLTRFVTNHTKSQTMHAYCSVEVYATNELHMGNYLVRSVHISIGVTDNGQQVHHQFEVRKYGVSDDRIYNFLSNITKVQALWGFGVDDKTINGVDVICDFDHDNNFAYLEVPECMTRVKYRAYDRSVHRQNLLPGISIMAPWNSWFVKEYGEYPHSLCGTFDDGKDMYNAAAAELGLNHKDLAVLYDVLSEAAPQVGNPKRDNCEAAFAAFKSSNAKPQDINACGPIVTVTKARKCVLRGGGVPIDVFTACLRYQQNGNAEDCKLLRGLQDTCGTLWLGPIISICS